MIEFPDVPTERLRAFRLVEVIELVTIAGEGTEDDPVREIRRYFSLQGIKLAEMDPGKRK